MASLVVIVLAPLLFAIVAVCAVVKLAALVLRVAFAPVIWLNGQQQRQRVSIRHYERRR
jgi:hypothetical protein